MDAAAASDNSPVRKPRKDTKAARQHISVTRLADYRGTSAFRWASLKRILAAVIGRRGMGLHDIFVCIDGTAAGDIRFQLGLNLAQTSKAHLTTVYALREHRGSAVPPAGVGLPPTVLG